MKTSELKVICPRCNQEFVYFGSSYRPFCTEKCKLIDLGQWLNESYVVHSDESNFDSEEGSDEFTNE